MNQKSRYAFRIVLGGWLAYIGCSLLYQMYTERPSNMVLICVIAVVFVLIGAFCVLHSLKKVLDLWKGEMPGTAAEEVDTENTEARSQKRRNEVQSVVLTQTENEPETDEVQEAVAEQIPEEQISEDREEESVSENIQEEHPETEEASEEITGRNAEILDIDEDEADDHADEIENDYEEK